MHKKPNYVVATGADPEFGRSSGPGEKSISGAFISLLESASLKSGFLYENFLTNETIYIYIIYIIYKNFLMLSFHDN